MITRMEAFISGMVFLMPGLTMPISALSNDAHQYGPPSSYVQHNLRTAEDEAGLCVFSQDSQNLHHQFTVRLLINEPVGNTTHSDWQYYVFDSDVHNSAEFSPSDNRSHSNGIFTELLSDNRHSTWTHCLKPLKSPQNHQPSFFM